MLRYHWKDNWNTRGMCKCQICWFQDSGRKWNDHFRGLLCVSWTVSWCPLAPTQCQQECPGWVQWRKPSSVQTAQLSYSTSVTTAGQLDGSGVLQLNYEAAQHDWTSHGQAPLWCTALLCFTYLGLDQPALLCPAPLCSGETCSGFLFGVSAPARKHSLPEKRPVHSPSQKEPDL